MAVKTAPIRDIDRGWGALMRRLASGKAEITVGIHSQDGDVPKKGDDAGGSTLLDVAVAHEFGLGVPRRSFIADWKDENKERHQKQIAAMAKAVVAGTMTAEIAAERLGNLWVGEVQKRIAEGIKPKLSERRIEEKKSSVPFINTGQLRSSVAYAINGKLRPSKSFEMATRERGKAEKKTRKKAVAELKRSAKKAVRSAVKEIKKTATATAKDVARDTRKVAKKLSRNASKLSTKTSRSTQKAAKSLARKTRTAAKKVSRSLKKKIARRTTKKKTSNRKRST